MLRTLLLSAGALLLFAAGGRAGAVRLPNGDALREVDFERHVVALLGRSGCNAGSCHGSFQGKGGFRLSLFSYDPGLDYRSLTRDSLGRRTNPNDPDRSLVLLTPTATVPQEGGRGFAPGWWQYHVLREWIAGGRPWRPGSAAVRRLDVPPAEALLRPGGRARLRVLAEFADGTRAD